jgi:benzoyl-CoA reductase/2-hydroxyglutaryl-CoA dehydratase subunit BcrC/BadD/HgdB
MSPTPLRDGLFARLHELGRVLVALPPEMSDAATEGLLRALPPDSARGLSAALRPELRTVSLSFLRLMAEWIQDVQRARQDGRRVVLIPFNFPPEVIRIFRRAVPLTCEVLTTLAVAALEGQGERYWDWALELGLPESLCSSSTITLGSLLSGRDLAPDIIVQSTAGACDANSKIHEFVSLQLGVPQVFIEKPADDSARARALHRRYFRRFIGELEELLGERLDDDHMRSVLEHANAAAGRYYDLYDLQRRAPSSVPNLFPLYSYSVRFSAWGLPQATELLERMVQTAASLPPRPEVVRALWLYVGYYIDLYGLFTWLEEQGITYLDDALALYSPQPVETRDRETMLDGLARTVFDYPMTRTMGASSISQSWIEDMVHAIGELRATCAIFSGHHACKQTWSVFARVRSEIMRRTGIPVLGLQGDSWNRRITPPSALRDEIRSFVDTVVQRKRRRLPPRPVRSGGC